MVKEKEIAFSLLENGLDFISSAIDHLIDGSDKSDVKYGILHLSSGVGLILKYRLSKEHWSLLFQNVDLANKVSFESGDFISVNSKTCIDRLKGTCSVDFDEKTLKQLKHLRERRNRLEHFGVVDSELALKASFVKVLNFVLDFIDENLEEDDLEDCQEIMDNIRSSLGKFEDFIEHRLKTIKASLEAAEKSTCVTLCPTCYQKALVIDDGVKCYFCGYSNDGEKAANEFVENILGESKYSAVKDGGEYPLYYCVECGNESMVNANNDEEATGWICFSCGYEWDQKEIDYCTSCGQPYRVNDDDIGLCFDCIEQKLAD